VTPAARSSAPTVGGVLLEAFPALRYVAVSDGGEPRLTQRAGLSHASAADSDRYEELLVNPTLLTLAHRRGAIDCGGLEYLVIRYGYFYQLVHPTAAGHVSVGIEASADPIALVGAVRRALGRAG